MKTKLWTTGLAAILLAAGLALADGTAVPPNPAATSNAVCPAITAEQLRAMIKTNKDLVVVDVLPKSYYDSGHITGSISIQQAQLMQTCRDWPRDRQIVVYCKDLECNDSRDAATLLVKAMGFTRVLNYEGGIEEWEAKKFEVERTGK